MLSVHIQIIMRIQHDLDSFITLLDNIIHESQPMVIPSGTLDTAIVHPSPELIEIYKQCHITRTYIIALRAVPNLKWDTVYRMMTKICLPIRIYISDETFGDILNKHSISLEAFGLKWKEWGDKTAKALNVISEIGDKLRPLESDPLKPITFDSIIGAKTEKEKLQDGFIQPFEYPTLYPKRASGVLLYGVAGTGKTLLAKACVNELKGNALFFAPPGDSFRGEYEGQTEAKIVALFDTVLYHLNVPNQTKKFAVIFIDEGEALLGKGRDTGDASKQRSVTTFLACMDGIQSDPRICVFIATNYPDLDPAILRRLSCRIHVHLPETDAIITLVWRTLMARFIDPLPVVFNSEAHKLDQMLFLFETFGSSNVLQNTKEAKKDIVSLLVRNEKEGRPGYSPSDIIRGIDIACNFTARRCINDKDAKFFRPSKIVGERKEYSITALINRYNKDGSKTKNGRLNASFSEVSDVFVYQINPLKASNGSIVDGYPVDIPGITKKEDMKGITKDRVISFDFRLQDIIDAFKPINFRNSLTIEDITKLEAWENSTDV